MPKPPPRKRPYTRVLGIDPGLATVGYAIADIRARAASLVICDVIRTPADLPSPARLQSIFAQINNLIAAYAPDEAAIEEFYFIKNVRTAQSVGQARGVAILALAEASLPIWEYSPMAVKLAVAGKQLAPKAVVGECVRVHFRLSDVPRPDDAADAAAVVLCHCHRRFWKPS